MLMTHDLMKVSKDMLARFADGSLELGDVYEILRRTREGEELAVWGESPNAV